MKKSISKKNIIMKISIRKNCFFFLGLYIVYFLLSTCIHNVGDDLVFQKGIEQYGSLHGWIIFFSNNWSGRIIPQGILVALLQFPESIFHMINALMWVLLFTYVVKVYDIHRNFDMKKTIITISILTFSVIPKSVLSQATFWKCANVLYLWGSAMMLIAIYPLISRINNKNVKRGELVLSFIAGFYAVGYEQIAAFLSVLIPILCIILMLKEKHFEFTYTIFALGICGFSIFFGTMKGNSVRSQAEILGNFQDYDMFSVVDKILLGIKYAIENMESEIPLLLFIASIIILYRLKSLRLVNKILLTMSYLSFFYFGFAIIASLGNKLSGSPIIFSKIFTLINPDTTQFGFNYKVALLEIFNITMIIFIGTGIGFLVSSSINVLAFLSYFGGIATMIIMGFSPTLYASSDRPRFVGYFLILCSIFGCISTIYKDINIHPFLSDH